MSYDLTRTRIALLLHAPDVATLLATYNRIEVMRAPAEDGTYELITHLTAAQPASITASREGPYRLSEAYISLMLPDGSQLDHQFAAGSPLTAAEVALELNNLSVLLDCTTSGQYLVLRTAATGTAACLQVLGGDACWWLGLTLLDSAFGKDLAPTMSSPTVLYTQEDLNGSLGYAYRYRFAKVSPPAQSIEYAPIATGRDIVLDITDLAMGTLHVSELSGTAGTGRRVHVANKNLLPGTGTTPPGVLPGGIFVLPRSGTLSPSGSGTALVVGDQVKEPDASGNVSFALVRGSTVEFYVTGSALHRTITVPDTEEFDMLDPTLSGDDPWGIVETPYTALPKTTIP